MQKTASGFPTNYRHTLGQRSATSALQFLEGIVRTNYLSDKRAKAASIAELRTHCYLLTLEIRMAKDLKIIPSSNHAHLNQMLVDIAKQLKGWQLWAEKALARNGETGRNGVSPQWR